MMILLLLTLLAGAAIADHRDIDRHHPACFFDRLQFCRRTTGLTSTLECLAQHESLLSSSCHASLLPSPLFQCSDDLAVICRDNGDDYLQLMSCLWQHSNSAVLSSRCKKGTYYRSCRVCKADKKRLCKDVHGLVAVMSCMNDHEAELSPKCKKVVDHCPLFQCAHDVQRLCPEAKNHRQFLQCIFAHQNELSEQCRQSLVPPNSTEAYNEMDRFRGSDMEGGGHHGGSYMKYCKSDLKQFCHSKKKMLEQMSCLVHHEDQLSPHCKQIVHRCPAFHCTDDVIKFCPETKTQEQFIACLWNHRRELSDECFNQNATMSPGSSPSRKVGSNSFAELGEYTLRDQAAPTDQAATLLPASEYKSWTMSWLVMGVAIMLFVSAVVGVMYMYYRYKANKSNPFENVTAYYRI